MSHEKGAQWNGVSAARAEVQAIKNKKKDELTELFRVLQAFQFFNKKS